jgi:hypothetical protein
MRKIRIVGFGLFTALALCVVVAAPALAASEWLVEGLTFAGQLQAETPGELRLIKLTAAGGAQLVILDCEGSFDGFIESNGKDGVTAVLDSAKKIVGVLNSEDVNKTPISCTSLIDPGTSSLDCKENSLASLWVIGIEPGLGDFQPTELKLVNGRPVDTFSKFNNLGEAVGFDVECEILLGIKASEECTGAELNADVENVAGAPASVLGTFLAPELKTEIGNCTTSGVETAVFEGSGHTWALEGETRLETSVNVE